jgi:hypothetical protein
MNRTVRIWICASLLTASGLSYARAVVAQVVSSGTMAPPSSSGGGKDLTVDNALEMENPQEAADFRAFESIPLEKLPKKIQAGENFVKKYNDSVFRAKVLSELAVVYIQAGQMDKGLTAGATAANYGRP